MSIWINASGSPNINSARVRARNVLPTPVGPRNTNEPIGRRGSFKSARDRRNALLMAVTASSWPMTRCFMSLSIISSFCVSSCSIRWSGTPVTFEMMYIMSSAVTTTSLSSRSSRHLFRMASSFSFVCFSLSRSAAAFSKSCALIAPSFSKRISSISFSISFTSGGRVMALMRARAPASSMTSIALSGRNRPVI